MERNGTDVVERFVFLDIPRRKLKFQDKKRSHSILNIVWCYGLRVILFATGGSCACVDPLDEAINNRHALHRALPFQGKIDRATFI